MITAIVNNTRVFATPKTHGLCPLCKTEVISKCGSLNAWHFAHSHLPEGCDDWKDKETEWHLKWKSWFLPEDVEVIKITSDGRRIADIKIGDIVLELQHSPIQYSLRKERELFWGSVFWITDANPKNLRFGKTKLGGYWFKWFHPKRWITTDPPHRFYIDLLGKKDLFMVTKMIAPNFGFGEFIDRVSFVKSLKKYEASCAGTHPHYQFRNLEHNFALLEAWNPLSQDYKNLHKMVMSQIAELMDGKVS